MTPHIAPQLATKPALYVAGHYAPILIQVPTVSARSRPSGRVRPTKGRRRLRREVRVAASTLAFAAPMSWFLLGFAPLGPESSTAARPAATADAAMPSGDPGPRVTITIDASPIIPLVRDAPVVLPAGYVVPEDGPEVSSHAGG